MMVDVALICSIRNSGPCSQLCSWQIDRQRQLTLRRTGERDKRDGVAELEGSEEVARDRSKWRYLCLCRSDED